MFYAIPSSSLFPLFSNFLLPQSRPSSLFPRNTRFLFFFFSFPFPFSFSFSFIYYLFSNFFFFFFFFLSLPSSGSFHVK
ncbi:hypothetical protein BJX96DRAFT_33276 [Aspergillus floccosus]